MDEFNPYEPPRERCLPDDDKESGSVAEASFLRKATNRVFGWAIVGAVLGLMFTSAFSLLGIWEPSFPFDKGWIDNLGIAFGLVAGILWGIAMERFPPRLSERLK